jgi:hypothetical protein
MENDDDDDDDDDDDEEEDDQKWGMAKALKHFARTSTPAINMLCLHLAALQAS